MLKMIQWPLLMAACMSLLTACGGGGGGSKDKTPSSPKPETQLSVSYTTSLSDDPAIGYQIDVVDPSKATLVRSVKIDGPHAWRTTFNLVQSSDGRTQTRQHEAALHYIAGQKVYALNLLRTGSTEPRQVSSLSDACSILWHIEADSSGNNIWMAITRAGADRHCGTNDDAVVVVNSTMSATTDASTAPFDPEKFVTAGRDSAGRLQSLITFDPNTAQFVHWYLGSNVPSPSPVSNGQGFSANTSFQWLGLLPGFGDRGIVQVDGSFRMLLWNSNGAIMSSSITSGSLGSDGPLVAADTSRLYVVRQQPSIAIIAFDGTVTTPPIVPLEASKGQATQLMVSGDALWVVQQNTSLPAQPSTLTMINKLTGASQVIDSYALPPEFQPSDNSASDIRMTLAGVNGTRLVYSKPSDIDDDASALYIIDRAEATPRLLAPQVTFIGAREVSTALIGQSSDATHLFWCDMGTPSSPEDCTAKRFKGYNFATGTVTALGQGLTDRDASKVLDYADLGSEHEQNSLIRGYASTPSEAFTTLWQFTPDVAGSLVFIAGAGWVDSGSSTGSTTPTASPGH